jgi:hypothetical protein
MPATKFLEYRFGDRHLDGPGRTHAPNLDSTLA